MFRKPSFVVRAISTIATFALALTGLSVLAIAPAVASTPTAAVVYDSLPAGVQPSYQSVGYEANGIREFGDYVKVTPGGGILTSATVGFTSWACESSSWNAGTCATTPGATFTHDITLNVYDVDKSGANPAVGALLGTVTQNTTFPYRPSADPLCTGSNAGKWHDSVTNSCRNGYATNVSFDLTAANITTDDDVIISIAYNTRDYGPSPMGTTGPWDSLNVSLAPAVPSVGTDETEDEAFISDGAHGNVLSLATGYTGYHGLILQLSAVPVAASSTSEVTVRQADVKPTENGTTYLEWHEGKSNATPAYSVKPEGIHLGDGAASTIIKGIANQEVTKAQLRALILASASSNVVTVSDPTRLPTFQVPVSFGTALTAGNYTFTTLQTSMNVGANSFTLAQDWRTSRAFGGYSVQGTDSLGNFLDKIFQSPHVWLAGFGIQSDKPAVISNVTWDGTLYTFTQPTTTACTPPLATGPAATNLDSNGWTFLDTRAEGHNVFTADGLHIYTDSNTSLSKAAGYLPTDIALEDAGVPKLNLGATSGGAPSVQLVVDFDNNGATDGILVGETIYGDDYWLPNSGAQFVKDAAPSHTGGSGSSNHGTLDQWLASFPDARIKQIGYSLGSGVLGSAVIQSIEVGCQTFGFSTAVPTNTITTQTVNEFQISNDVTPYTGWHDDYGNAARAFSVQADGLHFGAPVHSQPLFGFATPIASPDLESFVTSANVDITAGNVSFQLPLFYGNKDSVGPNTPRYTTLRIEDLPLGQQSFSVTDKWLASSNVLTNAGVIVVPAGTKLSLADWNNVFAALGPVNLLGFAVQADAASVVKSVTANNVKYVFTPYTVPALTPPTVMVYESDIAPTEITTGPAANYTQWHEGASPENAVPAYDVTKDGLTLGIGAKSQILKGLSAPITNHSVGELIAGAGVDVAAGWVTYQIPVLFGPTSRFGTLHSTSLTTGNHTFDLNSLWRLSKSIADPAHPGTNLVDAFADYPLSYLLDTMDTVTVLGFGVQTDAPGVNPTSPARITSITFNQTKYSFTGPINAGSPVITGTLTVGQTLTAVPGTWTPPGVTFTYQWKSNGSNVGTGSTYTLQGSDLNHTIAVVVTGHLTGYDNLDAVSPGRSPVAAAALAVGSPAVSGTAVIGQSLSAAPGTWGPAPVSVSYQWLSDGNPIPGATGSSYGVVAADAGHKISVKVTGVQAGYTTASAISPQTTTVPAGTIAAGTPTITGTAQVGQDLTAVPGTWGPSPVALTYQWLRDGVPIVGANGSDYTVVVADGGAHLSVTVTGTKSGYSTVGATSAQTTAVPFDSIAVNRLFGPNRFETAVAISQGFAPGVERLYLATGMGYADALSATPAAAHFESPLLLTSPDAIPAAVLAEIERLDPGKIVIVGLQGAVSAAVEAQLAALPSHPQVTRIGGADRYVTSRMIADEAFDAATTAYVATGANFPDALSAGPAAAHFDGPVVLVPGAQGSLDAATLSLISGLGVTKVKIAGGPAAVSNEIEEQLDGLHYTVKRNAGANRYSTAVAINGDEFASAGTVYLATGENFADALAGAARAGSEGMPLFVSPWTCIPFTVYTAIHDLNPSKVTLLGGTAALSVDVEALQVCS